jgi:type II secretory pathway pseudopilin PulG
MAPVRHNLIYRLRLSRQRPGSRQAFTLIEAAIVTVIVGVGIMAMLELLAAGSMANGASAELTTAMGLASNIHEMSLGVEYANVMTLNNLSYQPPVDAKKITITDSSLAQWRQQVTVNYLDRHLITSTVPNTQIEPAARITVTVSRNGAPVYTTSWLAAASEWTLP